MSTFDRIEAVLNRRFTELEAKITALDVRIASVERELALHRWMFGILFALQAAILVKLFVP